MIDKKEDSLFIDTLLQEKVHRAVDRVFSQNPPFKFQQIFNAIQVRIRNNSNELRQTLYRKYQNLINCSQLLSNLNSFAKDISTICTEMEKLIKNDNYEEQNKQGEQGIIERIEQLMIRNQYSLAMKQCLAPPADSSQEQVYYLEYLQIQIIENMEKYLLDNKFTKNIIQEIIRTLQLFIKNLTIDKIKQLSIQNNNQINLINIIYQHIKYLPKQDSYQQKPLIQSIFQFKLATLSKCSNYQNILNFYKNLIELCEEKETQSLRFLFVNNIEMMDNNLSCIFIRNEKGYQLKFQYDLYEKLVKSLEFKQILSRLQSLLNLNDGIILQFQKLWESYYKALIEYLIKQLSPIIYTQNLINTSKIFNKDTQLQEFKCYQIDKSIYEGFSRRDQYKSTIIMVKNNMQLLCEKGDINLIRQQFKKSIIEVNKDIDDLISSMNPHQSNLRRILIMVLLCSDFNRQCVGIYPWADLELEISQKLEKFAEIFVKAQRVNYLSYQKTMLNIDIFFTPYTSPKFSSKNLQLIQPIIISIVSKLLEIFPKNEEQLNSILKKLTTRSQTLSIYRCPLPNITQFIFIRKLAQAQLSMDEQILNLYKQGKKNDPLLEQQTQSENVGFQIGEKQSNDDMISIGIKSLNFISGFMKKKG